MSDEYARIYILRRRMRPSPDIWMFAFAQRGSCVLAYGLGRSQPVISNQRLLNSDLISQGLISTTTSDLLKQTHVMKRLRALFADDNKSFMFNGLSLLSRAGLVHYDVYIKWGEIFNRRPSPIRPFVGSQSEAELDAAGLTPKDIFLIPDLLASFLARNLPTVGLTAVGLPAGVVTTSSPRATDMAGADLAIKWVPDAEDSPHIVLSPYVFAKASLIALLANGDLPTALITCPSALVGMSLSTDLMVRAHPSGSPPTRPRFLTANTSAISAAGRVTAADPSMALASALARALSGLSPPLLATPSLEAWLTPPATAGPLAIGRLAPSSDVPPLGLLGGLPRRASLGRSAPHLSEAGQPTRTAGPSSAASPSAQTTHPTSRPGKAPRPTTTQPSTDGPLSKKSRVSRGSLEGDETRSPGRK